MKPEKKQLVWLITLSASVGCIGALVACFAIYFIVCQSESSRQEKNSDRVFSTSSIFHHTPPIPVSPALVRPVNPQKNEDHIPSSPIVTDTIADELPSFAPLVRQVIPAVVNISISRDPRDRIASPAKKDNRHKVKSNFSKLNAYRRTNKHHHSSLHKKHHQVLSRRRISRPVDDELTGAGSGFVVDKSGIIVTNRHVVGGAVRVMVSLSDGRSLPARILGDDPMTDIAVIKVESNKPLPCVAWGDSHQVEIGDWIMVAGNPFGFGSSVTAGIVSAVGRDLGIGSLDDFMQLDAPINPGNSGGPAFNLRGQVIAVNAAIASPSDGSVGLGFGIPTEIVAPIVEEITRTGHVEHGWLGVTLNDESSPMWVEEVDPSGAAWRGGLRREDRILAMGNVAVHDARTVLRSVAAAHPGTTFMFTIRRQGIIKTLSILLGPRPSSDL